MDKRIIIGLVAGALLGVIEMFLFKGSYALIIIPAILGAVIGFAQTQTLKLNQYIVGAIVGALFFIVIAAQSGLWLDDIATGAITGLAITFLISLVGPKLS